MVFDKIIEFFKSLFETQPAEPVNQSSSTGVIFNDPSLSDGVPFGEMVATPNPVVWKELDTSHLPDYKIYDQGRQSSCVAHARCLMASIMYFIRKGRWVDFSRAYVYRQRVNHPNPGMMAGDSFNIIAAGLLVDDFLPSDGLSEAEINAVRIEEHMNEVANGIQADRLIIVPPGNIETIASIMQTTGKPIMLFFRFGAGEWQTIPVVLVSKPHEAHAVVFPPHSNPKYATFGLYKGQKAIMIQDSAMHRTSTKGYRIITESFFRARNYHADYFMKFKFEKGTGEKPKYDGSVVSLQDCLRYAGFFPANWPSTGNQGPVTTQAIKDFQKHHGLEQTGRVGPKTRALLVSLF